MSLLLEHGTVGNKNISILLFSWIVIEVLHSMNSGATIFLFRNKIFTNVAFWYKPYFAELGMDLEFTSFKQLFFISFEGIQV